LNKDMNLTLRNVSFKALQSIIGFSLLAIQSRFLIQEELAIFAIAQSLFVIVALFDFGVGVKLTTWIVNFFDENDLANEDRKGVARALMIRKRNRIFAVGFVQSVFFGFVFLCLMISLTGEKTIAISCIFTISVFLHSVGLNFGRLFLATGDIALLVKLQLIGSFIAFLATALGLKSSFNLIVSILAMSLSSIFLGLSSLKIYKSERDVSMLGVVEYEWPSGIREVKKITYIQIGQSLHICLPLLVQFILVSRFSPEIVIVYAVCQKFTSSIGNIFGSEIQLNYSWQGTTGRIEMNDIARYYQNFAGFLITSCFMSIAIWLAWEDLYASIGVPSLITLLSFVTLGLLALIDQAIRYRLYRFSKFEFEMIASLIYVVCFVSCVQFSFSPTILALNLFLILSFIPKWFFVSSSRKGFKGKV